MGLNSIDRVSRVPAGRAPAAGRVFVQESFAAVASSVTVARRAITVAASRAGACEEQLEAIRLASSEALSNVVQHAYRGRVGAIHVTATVAGGELWVLIGDDGCGLGAGRDSDGLGLGLALIAQLTDDFTVAERSSGGIELRMRFVLRSEGAA